MILPGCARNKISWKDLTFTRIAFLCKIKYKISWKDIICPRIWFLFVKYPERILSFRGLLFVCLFIYVFMARIRSAKLYQTVSIPGDRSTIHINKKVILKVQYFRNYLYSDKYESKTWTWNVPAAQRRLAGEPMARPGILLLAGEPKARPGLLLSSRIYARSCPRSCLPICYFFPGLSGYFGAANPAGG